MGIGEINRQRWIHAARIMSNYCILGAVFLFCVVALPIMSFLWNVIGLFVVAVAAIFWLLTVGQLFELKSVSDVFFGNGVNEILAQVYKYMTAALPYVFTVTAVLAVASIVIVCCTGYRKKVGPIVASSIAVGIGLIALILVYLFQMGVMA